MYGEVGVSGEAGAESREAGDEAWESESSSMVSGQSS